MGSEMCIRDSYRGGQVELELSRELSDRVKALAQREGLTMHMVLAATWSALLSRLSGQDQVVVGTPVANRQRHEVEGLIGFFVNTLPLRADLSGSPSVKAFLHQMKSVTLGGYAHQDIPFERVVELVQPERSLSYSPLFQTALNFEHDTTGEDLDFLGVEMEGINSDEEDTRTESLAKFDLTLSLSDTPEGVVGGIEYAQDLSLIHI